MKRYFMVLGAILAVVIGGLYATKPKAGEIKRGVDEAMAAYREARAAAPPGALRDISLPQILEERDWILSGMLNPKHIHFKVKKSRIGFFHQIIEKGTVLIRTKLIPVRMVTKR